MLKSKRHAFLCGITGAGKTSFVKKFVIPVALKIGLRIIVIDFYGEYEYEAYPVIPIPRNRLPSIVARTIDTTGTFTYLALYEALRRSTSFREVLDELRKLMLQYEYRLGAAAALSRLLPLEGRGELTEKIELYGDVVRWDLSDVDEYARNLTAAFIVSLLSESITDAVVVAEESQKYWRFSDGATLEARGRKKRVKVIRVEHSLPVDNTIINYVVVIGNQGILNEELFYRRYSLPKQIKKLRDMEFLLFCNGEWYRFSLG